MKCFIRQKTRQRLDEHVQTYVQHTFFDTAVTQVQDFFKYLYGNFKEQKMLMLFSSARELIPQKRELLYNVM